MLEEEEEEINAQQPGNQIHCSGLSARGGDRTRLLMFQAITLEHRHSIKS